MKSSRLRGCGLYILDDDNNPVECPDPVKLVDWFLVNGERTKVGDTAIGVIWVSTIFLGIRHPGGIFETMVERPNDMDIVERYATWTGGGNWP